VNAVKLLKLLVVVFVLGALGWFAKQSVRVETSMSQVRITIDREALRKAGGQFAQQSQAAVSTAGQLLTETAKADDVSEPQKASGWQGIFSR
jgi:hypothetical protein